MHANDYDLNIHAPHLLAPQLRRIADRYRESAAELASAWCDQSAGMIWHDYARILERAAADAESALSEYPILDEEDHSTRQWDEIQEAWTYTSMRDRIVILAKHRLSIFAARRDDVPQGLPYYDDFYSPRD